ncbi:protein of unknown function (plasmid) [Azospirillum baldaniorum]|uniref:Uncharacterized protein n=1 Tax=Azospirillum baldaniorum TaxID=1064539 RepID=A0A9P1NQ23_9PROT|nr:protein of unknown function [Azospirillum baldaniorum]
MAVRTSLRLTSFLYSANDSHLHP